MRYHLYLLETIKPVNKSTKLLKFPRGESVFLTMQTRVSDFLSTPEMSRVSKEFKEQCGVTTQKSFDVEGDEVYSFMTHA